MDSDDVTEAKEVLTYADLILAALGTFGFRRSSVGIPPFHHGGDVAGLAEKF